jgi:hypothetical protein
MRNVWRRFRAMKRDALAAGARSDETTQLAQSEGRQSGPQGNAQNHAPNPFSTPSLNPGGNEDA